MSTCRFCKQEGRTKYELIKYGVRHYAHPDCGLKAKGSEFFNCLVDWQLERFPYFAANDLGYGGELCQRLNVPPFD